MNKKLQVFVSSTYTDLLAERQAAVTAILTAGHIPAGMELFTAGDQSQWDVIQQWIDESDVYMLILGGRYGSVDPSTGLAYTEMEYNYALEKGKPLFAIVINDDEVDRRVKIHGAAVMETDNKKDYLRFKAVVLSKMSGFFSDEKDVKLAILESIHKIESKNDLPGWISGKDATLAKDAFDEVSQLMKENRSLRDEIEKLQEKLTEGAAPSPLEAKFGRWREDFEDEWVTVPRGRIESLEGEYTLLEVGEKLSYQFLKGVSLAGPLSFMQPGLRMFELYGLLQRSNPKDPLLVLTNEGKEFFANMHSDRKRSLR